MDGPPRASITQRIVAGLRSEYDASYDQWDYERKVRNEGRGVSQCLPIAGRGIPGQRFCETKRGRDMDFQHFCAHML